MCWPVLSTALRIADGSAATTDLTMRETTDFSDGNSSSGSFCALMRRGAGSLALVDLEHLDVGIARRIDAGLLVVEVGDLATRRLCALVSAAWPAPTVFMKSGFGAPSSVRSLTSMSEVASS